MSETYQTCEKEYSVYPGILVEYHEVTGDCREFHHDSLPNVMEINHCHYGRVGWELNDGQSIYMGEGDVIIHSSVLCSHSKMHFPLGSYQGITIQIDFSILQRQPPMLLKNAPIDYQAIWKKYCRQEHSLTISSGSKLDQIIHDLYHLPDSLRESYLKIKTVEVLLHLSQNLDTAPPSPAYNSDVIETIQNIHQLLTEHLEKRYTIPELSSQYLINTSTLKEAFKAVYGAPIASYMKEYRIRHAARLLRHTEGSIAEIAASVGYETASKFTKAFKEVLGILPSEYRKG